MSGLDVGFTTRWAGCLQQSRRRPPVPQQFLGGLGLGVVGFGPCLRVWVLRVGYVFDRVCTLRRSEKSICNLGYSV